MNSRYSNRLLTTACSLLFFIISSSSESNVVSTINRVNDNISLTTNKLHDEFYLPSSDLEGTYDAICSMPENNGRHLALPNYVNTFTTCMQRGPRSIHNCAEDHYFFEFLEECIPVPCGTSFEGKISSAIESGRTIARPCRPCKISCYGDVFYEDRCYAPEWTSTTPRSSLSSSSSPIDGDSSGSTTTEKSTTPSTTTPNPMYECPENIDYAVNIAHPCGCRKYQICQRGRKTVAFCRKGMLYDIARRMCNRESDVRCPHSPNCDNELLLENQYDDNDDDTQNENLMNGLFDLIRSLSDDYKYNDTIDNVEPLGLFDLTKIKIKNIFNINVNVNKSPFDVESFGMDVFSRNRDNCGDPNAPRNFQFQKDYYDMYATCVNDRESKIVFCPDGYYFNSIVEFCIPYPDKSKFKKVYSGYIDLIGSNRCRYCTPQSYRSIA